MNMNDITKIQLIAKSVNETVSSVTIQWKSVPDAIADVYEIEQYSKNLGWFRVCWTSSNAGTVQGLEDNFAYRFRVKGLKYYQGKEQYVEVAESSEIVVSLQDSQERDHYHFCSGSIIKLNWILTAAHCVDQKAAKNIEVVFGVTDLTEAVQNIRSVTTIIIHDEFVREHYRNDIALLKLFSPLWYQNGKVSPVVLPLSGYELPLSDINAILIGWGKSSGTTFSALPSTICMFRAIKKGQQFLVKRLLRRRPSLIKYSAPNGHLPLANAIIFGDMSVIDVLISAGASVQDGNLDTGRTPLHFAFYYGNLSVSRLLINKKANINSKDIHGLTPCHYAVDANQYEILKFAFDNGADIEATDSTGYTLLLRAVIVQSDLTILKFLVAQGADVKATNKNGLSCIQLANLFRNTEFVKYFNGCSGKKDLPYLPFYQTEILNGEKMTCENWK